MEDASKSQRTAVVVLAAGKGTRMKGESSKVLSPLGGKPMVRYVLDAITASGVCTAPVIVVGYKAEDVRAAVGEGYTYVHQLVQLGTANAVEVTRDVLEGTVDQVIVLYGDHPCLTAHTIQQLARVQRADCVVTLLTTVVEDFNDWRAPLYDFGRVIRDERGNILRVVEVTDLTEEQRAIREVSLTMSCFRADWLWGHLQQLNTRNVQQEYYLADLVGLAVNEGSCVCALSIDPKESIGVNRPEHLQIAEKFLEERV